MPRNDVFEVLKWMTKAGFVLEEIQAPVMQSNRGYELRFRHPGLEAAYPQANAKKYYLKHLGNSLESSFGLTTGITSALCTANPAFPMHNREDVYSPTNPANPAWDGNALEELLTEVEARY